MDAGREPVSARVARHGIPPAQAERDRSVLLLAELVDELVDRVSDLVGLVGEQNALLAAVLRSGPAVGGEGAAGGDGMRITEPQLPPEDDQGQRPVAEPSTGPAPRRATAGKAAGKKTATAKATTGGAARRRTAGG